MPRTAAVVPSYCSWANLEQHLPVLLQELRPHDVEVVVTDDASPDGTADRVEQAFPDVRVLRRERNGGFGENCNSAVRALDGVDHVLLLNADVHVMPGFFPPLAAALDSPDVFAVSSVAVDEEGRLDGAKLGEMRRGLMRWRPLDQGALRGPHPSLYPVGAHVLFDRARFLELGGFDPLYRPFYWEDADLGYRAWKRGWRVVVEPSSRVEHRREGGDILRTRGKEEVETTILRNRFLFVWANVHDRRLWWRHHVLPIVGRVFTGWMVLDRRLYRSLFGALRRRGEAKGARRRARAAATRTDAEVLAELDQALAPYERGQR